MENWKTNIVDSVQALRAATDEYRAALGIARTGNWSVNLDRIRPVDAAVICLGGPFPRGPWRPHDHALFTIGQHFHNLLLDLEADYRRAAQIYAYGAAWAANEVIHGGTPQMVELPTDEDGRAIPGTRPSLHEHLEKWSGAHDFKQAEGALHACEAAQDLGDALAAQNSLADHEASEMHDAWYRARNLADAAREFGTAAEGALQFALNVIASGR